MFTVRYQESLQPEVYLSPELTWQFTEGYADWALNSAGTDLQGGGNGSDLTTAVIIQLFTNRRAEPQDNVPASEDQMGWFGDFTDIEDGEDQLGSRLWLLYREPLTTNTEKLAVGYAQEALQVLVNQGLFTSFDITATADVANNRLNLNVIGYGAASPLQQQFALLWS